MTIEQKRRRNAERAEEIRQLSVLEAVQRDGRVTQRHLAAKLGIALGLTNIYLKRLIRKGYIKCINVQSNRLLYLITPQGVAEKTRLTYEFVDSSLQLYRNVRRQLSDVLGSCSERGFRRIALFGTGEAAELAYLSLREQGLEPVAVFYTEPGGVFLGMPVRGLGECQAVAFDRVLVATLEKPDGIVAKLLAAGIPAEKLITFFPSLPDPLAS